MRHCVSVSTHPDELDRAVRKVLPLRRGNWELALADPAAKSFERGAGRILTLRFIAYDAGANTIRESKQQEVFFAPIWALEGDTPVLAFVEGWAAALAEVLEKGRPEILETAMPNDLIATDALELRNANTPDEYKAAALRKSRLGKFL